MKEASDRSVLRKATGPLGVGLALAAGVALPQKADADYIVDTNYFSFSSGSGIHIQFDEGSGALTVTWMTSSACAYGWQFYNSSIGCCSSGLIMYGRSTAASGYNSLYSFLAYQTAYSCASFFFENPLPDFNLASLPSGYDWKYPSNNYLMPSVGTEFYIGLRKNVNGTDAYHGWTHFEVGSAEHLETAFQTQEGGPIQLGAIPEPATMGLLAMGMAGVLACRRHRVKAS